MPTQTDITSDLTDNDKAVAFQFLDVLKQELDAVRTELAETKPQLAEAVKEPVSRRQDAYPSPREKSTELPAGFSGYEEPICNYVTLLVVESTFANMCRSSPRSQSQFGHCFFWQALLGLLIDEVLAHNATGLVRAPKGTVPAGMLL
ncbi:hypothetical protein EV421DRAFT_1737684 [Armillaria borealis]|uniref:Uncharacterized protein n=1 Tax=Armillaria borealis TaxID=47425 RepID=A0AA39MN08_9AGAR|nr:hypothetical protein EV421DRAFT_1737684 [Armillaria borealis]